jgi:hypothetical protein
MRSRNILRYVPSTPVFTSSLCCRKKHHKFLPTILPNLLLLLNDQNLQVQKKVVQVSTTLYRELISWMAELNENCNENAVVEVWNAARSLVNCVSLVSLELTT